MRNEQYFRTCRLCPRECGVNRLAGHTGFCGESAQLRVATIEAHFGEEPPISGKFGSGTIFFSGCTLQCDFCQNYQLSHQHLGDFLTPGQIAERLKRLYHSQKIHNVNFVTPDHFFPQCWELVRLLRAYDVQLPIIYNLSGYECVDSLRATEAYGDIYLPDFKYADRDLAKALSHCNNYPAVALDAIAEMVRQKGFLDACEGHISEAIAQQGVLVRHLILPGQVQNSLDALSMLFLEFGRNLPISVMSQYHPVQPCAISEMARRITEEEFQQVYDHILSLGFQHVFVQYPEKKGQLSFLPDFTQSHPFRGNWKT